MARLVWPGSPNYMLFTFRGLRTRHRTCLGRVGVRHAHGQDDGRDNLFFEPDQVRSPPLALDYTRGSCLGVLSMRWPKYWSFSFSIIPSKDIPGL